MNKGRNLASPEYNTFNERYALSDIQRCIFISHKKEDTTKAKEISDYIIKQGMDIYLDIYDSDLQIASDTNDHRAITTCLEEGLSKSTHLLSLISERTRGSWWVPYEIGFCKGREANIASLLLQDFNDNDIPSYLHTSRLLYGTESFDEYLKEVYLSTQSLLEKYASEQPYILHNKFSHHPLSGVLKNRK